MLQGNNPVRQAARYIFLSVAGSFARPSNGVHILNGHMAHPVRPDALQFDRMLSALERQVRFVRIEEAVALIVSRAEPDEPLVAFTFDDGFAECRDVIALVLEKHGTNAAFFINPNFVEGDGDYIRRFTEEVVKSPGKSPMRWQEVLELQNRGHIIGAHTLDHALTAIGDEDALRHQIVDCRAVIEAHTGVPCEYFAWPFGRLEHTNEAAVRMACATYRHVFSQSDHRHYLSFGGRVINRRHFEPFWPVSHVRYFLSCRKSYE